MTARPGGMCAWCICLMSVARLTARCAQAPCSCVTHIFVAGVPQTVVAVVGTLLTREACCRQKAAQRRAAQQVRRKPTLKCSNNHIAASARLQSSAGMWHAGAAVSPVTSARSCVGSIGQAAAAAAAARHEQQHTPGIRGTDTIASGSSALERHKWRTTTVLSSTRYADGDGARKSNCMPTPYLCAASQHREGVWERLA